MENQCLQSNPRTNRLTGKQPLPERNQPCGGCTLRRLWCGGVALQMGVLPATTKVGSPSLIQRRAGSACSKGCRKTKKDAKEAGAPQPAAQGEAYLVVSKEHVVRQPPLRACACRIAFHVVRQPPLLLVACSVAFHIVRQPPASVPPRPRLPKSHGAWARTALASEVAVHTAPPRLKKGGPNAHLVLSMKLSSSRCLCFLCFF